MNRKVLSSIIIAFIVIGLWIMVFGGFQPNEKSGVNFTIFLLGLGFWFVAMILKFIQNQLPRNLISWSDRKRRALGLKT